MDLEQLDKLLQEEKQDEMKRVINFVGLLLRHWYWVVLSVLLSLGAAKLYVRYSTPIYSVSSDIKLKEQGRYPSNLAVSVEDIGVMGAVTNVFDETEVIRSRSILRNVINRLNLQTSYVVSGRIKDSELYTNSPVIVGMDQANLEQLKKEIRFTMELKEEKLYLTGILEEVKIDTLFTELPALLKTPFGNISFTQNEATEMTDRGAIEVVIVPAEQVIRKYRAALTVTQKSGGRWGGSNLVTLQLNTPSPAKGIDFLTTLVDVYNNEMIEDKNTEARNTQQFINERLDIIYDELSTADSSVEAYKRKHRMTDIQADLSRDMQIGSKYEQRLVEVETQLNVVHALSEYVNNPENNRSPVPSNIGIEDPTLAATSKEYNKMLLERERMAQSMTEENPVLRRMDEQISGLRESINLSIESVQQGLNIQRRDALNQTNIYTGRLGSKPTQEREFVDLTREQQIKQNLFLMLLQKREENALALAATSNMAKIINEPVKGPIVSPKSKLIYFAALMLGLLLPLLIIYLIDFFSITIKTRSDVEQLSKLGILGDIPKHEGSSYKVVSEGASTELDEAFRMLRTNLLMSLGVDNKVVTCTSTVSGEGKTFVAINLASSLALLDNRVLLLGMDLRLPRLHEYLEIGSKVGLTGYLSGFEQNWKQLITSVDSNGNKGNLDILHAGHVPPNPAELLSNKRLDQFMDEVREEYDYIVIDSAPVGLVTDSLVINRVTDANIYITRAGFSAKSSLEYANKLQREHRLKNMMLVVNDVKEFYHGYGNNYGYGYGAKVKKKKWWQRKA